MPQQDATLNLATLLKLDPELGEEVGGEGELAPSDALLEADGLRRRGAASLGFDRESYGRR